MSDDVKKPPSLPTMLKNAVIQAGQVIAHAVQHDGVVFADEAVAAARIKICSACPEFDADGSRFKQPHYEVVLDANGVPEPTPPPLPPEVAKGRCILCGCLMSNKVKLASAHCPMNPPKWSTALPSES